MLVSAPQIEIAMRVNNYLRRLPLMKFNDRFAACSLTHRADLNKANILVHLTTAKTPVAAPSF